MRVARRGRTMWWVLGTLVAIAVLLAIGLQVAIARNGPAVLDTVDRIAGGARGVERTGPIAYGDHAQQKLYVQRIPVVETNEVRPVVVFVHGGSWRDGDPQYYDFIGRNLAPRGFVVVNLGYRLGTDGRWPAMLEDSASGVAWVKANIAEYGGDPERITLMGHSAGAYNVAMLALDEQWLGREGLSSADIAGVISLAGPLDFYPFDSDSTRAAFATATRPEMTQPVNHITGRAPPFLLLHGLDDTTVKPRNSRKLDTLLRQAGDAVRLVEYPQMDHTGIIMALATPWSGRDTVTAEVLEFARNPRSSVPVQP